MTERYLSLLKKSLLNELYVENNARFWFLGRDFFLGSKTSTEDLQNIWRYGKDLLHEIQSGNRSWWDFENFWKMKNIQDRCNFAHSRIGSDKMNAVHASLDTVRQEEVPGDFLSVGVDGISVFVAGYFQAHGMNKKVHVVPFTQNGHESYRDHSNVIRGMFERYGLSEYVVLSSENPVSFTQMSGIWISCNKIQNTDIGRFYSFLNRSGCFFLDRVEEKGTVQKFYDKSSHSDEIQIVDDNFFYWRK